MSDSSEVIFLCEIALKAVRQIYNRIEMKSVDASSSNSHVVSLLLGGHALKNE